MQSRQNDDPDPLNDQEAMDGIDFSMWQNSNYQSNVPSMTNYMFEEFGVQLPVRFAPQSSSIIVDFKGHMVCIVPVSIESGRASTIAHCIINLLNKG